jgi:site-specific recombinase XerD
MNIRIESNFEFTVDSIQYSSKGELCITLGSVSFPSDAHYQYTATLGSGQAEEKPAVSLLGYAKNYAASANIKSKTKDSYRLMCKHLDNYGDCLIDKVTTGYLQGFIPYLQSQGLKPGTVRLYFQKLACVLHDAYKNGLFDDRILLRVKRPRREQEKKCFLSEAELKRLARHRLSEGYGNIESMFLFSCMTGLRYSDVQGLRWKDVKRNGKHLQLEFHQQKTDTREQLPLCAEAEALLRSRKRSGEHVFEEETNQKVNMVLKRWCREAKIKKPVTFHSARHTFCVLLLTKDVPIYTVQQLMCHSDINTTKTYADILNRTKAKAVKRMPAIMCCPRQDDPPACTAIRYPQYGQA